MRIMREEKKRALVKYCLRYKNGGRINKCVNNIGWALNNCGGTAEDAKMASFLLSILTGDVE